MQNKYHCPKCHAEFSARCNPEPICNKCNTPMERGEALKLSNHGCAIYNGEQLLATTFIDETGERMPTDKEIALAAALCNAVAALDRIALNLQNKAMTSEQERAFSYSPAAESWRIYLSGLILEARNDAKFALQHIKNNLPVVS